MAEYSISVDGNPFTIDEETLSALDLLHLDDDKFHVLQGNKSYKVEVIEANFLEKALTLRVNGNIHSLKIADTFDETVKKMGLLSKASQKLNDIKAPMPGLIIEVMASPGQEVSKGTPLVVLSAMKMENVIAAEGDGVVKTIAVQQEDAVEKGQLLIEIE